MKRVKAACICQTLLFAQKEELGAESAARQTAAEVAAYKQRLERSRVQYRVVEETAQPDGSVLLKIIKQYNQSPVGDYLN